MVSRAFIVSFLWRYLKWLSSLPRTIWDQPASLSVALITLLSVMMILLASETLAGAIGSIIVGFAFDFSYAFSGINKR